MKKLIHILTPSFFPNVAGMEINILEVYRVFAKKGWRVVVHTSKNTLNQRNILPDRDIISGISVRRYKAGNFGFIPKFDWTKTDIVALHNFDLFIYTRIFLYAWFLKILRKKNFTLILVPHGVLSPEWKWFSKQGAFLRKIIYPVICVFLINQTVDGIRTVSEWEKSKLIKMGVKPGLIMTITNGIEKIAFSNIDQQANINIKKTVEKLGRYIIQIGRINREKNYEAVIKVLQKLPSDVKFVIVGPAQDNHYREYLEELAKKLNLEKRVVFLDTICGHDKYYLIKHAKMMVHMARWESFCNVVHEAMSQGLVCVVANKMALPYLVENGVNGYCVNPDDFESLAEKINFVLNNHNSSIIKSIKEKCSNFAKNHTWENVASQVENFYFSKN